MSAAYASFAELRSAVEGRRASGDLAGALDLVSREGPAFPEQIADVYFWRVSLLGQLGRVDEALRVFAEALAAGCRYPLPALQGRLFAALHEIVEFERLEHIAAMRYDAESEASRPKLVLRRPSAGSAGTLLVLHGNNGRADRTVPHWEGVLELGWTLALAQSSEISWTPGMFVWNDARRARAQLERHLDELGGSIAVGGYSMGALRALELAASAPDRVTGVIVVGPYLPPDAVRPLAEVVAVPTAIVVGERDEHGRAGSEELARGLGERHVRALLHVIPGHGHAYPADMARHLRTALDFVRA